MAEIRKAIFVLVAVLCLCSQAKAEEIHAPLSSDNTVVTTPYKKQPPTITFDVPEKPGTQAVFLLHHAGQDYQIVKLLDQRKSQGEVYRSYELLDSKYPLTISDPVYRANKALLKEVPDFRPSEQRHPFSHWCEQHGSAVGVILMVVDFFI